MAGLNHERLNVIYRPQAKALLKKYAPESDEIDMGLFLEEFITRHNNESMDICAKQWAERMKSNSNGYMNYKTKTFGGSIDLIIQIKLKLFNWNYVAETSQVSIEQLNEAYGGE